MSLFIDHHNGRKETNSLRLLGSISLVLGVLAIAASFLVTLTTMLIFGVLLIMAGIAQFFHALKFRTPDRNWEAVSGALYLTLGGLIVIDPVRGAIGLTFIVAILFLARGGIQIAMAVTGRRWGRSPGWHLGSGLLNVLIAIFIFVALPEAGAELIGVFVGIELLLGGLALLLAPKIIRQAETHVL
jgi:uncharacterized membrane protein HdeD (DUF308 family)